MANLAPFPKFRAFDALGLPLAGGQLYTYEAGTTNPKASFADASGAFANPNPVILDSAGQADVWLDGEYNLRLLNANGVTQWTVDNVVGVGTATGGGGSAQASEWLVQADAPTFISGTQYSVPGDKTTVYHVGRRHRATVSGGTAYATITASSFGAGITTITLANDGIPLDGGLSAVSVGINSADNPSISVDCVQGIGTLDTVPTGAIFMWPTGVAPSSGYLFCDGAAVDRTTYAALFAVIGETFGAGDGSTTFNVPDFRGRGPLGFGQSPDSAEGGGQGTARSLAEKLGAETHTQSEAELAPHTHTGGVDGSQRQDNEDTGGQRVYDANTAFRDTGSTGSASPMDIMNPFLVIGFVIKT